MADTENVTPPMKKLKQARLPFQILSSPDELVQPRKLKLFCRENGSIEKANPELSEKDEPVISKENNLNSSSDFVVISDDDSNSIDERESRGTIKNPLVNLVDKVLKKKARKNNPVKKRKPKSQEGDNGIVSEEKQEIPLNHEAEENVINSSLKNAHDVDVGDNKIGTDKIKAENSKCISESETEVPSMRCTTVKEVEPLTVERKSIDQSEENQTTNLTPKPSLSENYISEEKLPLPPDPSRIIASEIIPTVSSLDDNLSDVEMSSPSDHNRTPSGNISASSIVTPKNKRKSLRMNTTQESNDSMLDESVGECSPKMNLNKSKEIASSPNLTPKQLQKKIESAKKREEREKEKLERERKRQVEKEEKAKLRQEKEDQRRKEREEKEEQKRKEKEDKEEQKRKEKEEREKQKELEKREKEERDEQKKKEKEEKEEQKRKEKEAKEEERRKKQEALEEDKRQKELEKVEQELKKKKAAEAFANFFVPKQKKHKEVTFESENKSSTLSTFMIKSDMRLAPLVRNSLTDEQKMELDSLIAKQVSDTLYLKQLQNKDIIPMVSVKTWQSNDKDEDDCMIVESGDELPPCETAGEAIIFSMASREKLKPKLLSFHENTRPPYWGTWRKKSKQISPRRPFATDTSQLEYEVDSEEEWEEEGEGESVGGSVADDEEGDADDYEVDNEFFVPHGYLSDEEATKDDDDVMSLSPETQKAKLKHLEEEFESEMKKPTEKLKPRLYGLLWENSEGGKPDNCIDALWNYFGKFTMIMEDPTPLLQPSADQEDADRKVKKRKMSSGGENGQKREKKKARSEKDIKKTKTLEPKKPESKNQPIINAFLVKSKDST